MISFLKDMAVPAVISLLLTVAVTAIAITGRKDARERLITIEEVTCTDGRKMSFEAVNDHHGIVTCRMPTSKDGGTP